MAHTGTSGYARVRTLEPLLTLKAVCELLGVSKQTVYREMQRGELHPTRVGERLRFVQEDVRDYLERRREPAP